VRWRNARPRSKSRGLTIEAFVDLANTVDVPLT
jgi:hypothetical protein